MTLCALGSSFLSDKYVLLWILSISDISLIKVGWGQQLLPWKKFHLSGFSGRVLPHNQMLFHFIWMFSMKTDYYYFLI